MVRSRCFHCHCPGLIPGRGTKIPTSCAAWPKTNKQTNKTKQKAVENSMEDLQTIRLRITMWSSNSTSGSTPKRSESKVLSRYLHTCVLSCMIDSSQKVETTHVSISRRMDKLNVLHSYNGILFSFQKEGNPDTGNNVDEPWGHYAQWNKPDTKGQTLCDST